MTRPGKPALSGPRVERMWNNCFQVMGLRHLSPEFRTRAEAEAWLARELAKRDAPKVGPRPCLRCGKTFHSEGVHNRMCNPCRGMGDALGAYGLVPQQDGRKASGIRKH
ncbi:MAG: hypothetical protein R3D60_13075 [Paracoccaceae bacterium]